MKLANSFTFALSLLFAIGLFCTPSRAQLRKVEGMDFSLQAGIEAPIGDSGLVKSGAWGASLTASLPVSTLIDVSAGIGYLKFGQTDVSIDSNGQKQVVSKQYTNFPFFAGIRFIFDGPTLLPYFGAEISLNDLLFHVTNGVHSTPDASDTKLGYAFLAGARVPFSTNWSIDATAKYHVIPGNSDLPDTKFFSINAGLAVHLDL